MEVNSEKRVNLQLVAWDERVYVGKAQQLHVNIHFVGGDILQLKDDDARSYLDGSEVLMFATSKDDSLIESDWCECLDTDGIRQSGIGKCLVCKKDVLPF